MAQPRSTFHAADVGLQTLYPWYRSLPPACQRVCLQIVLTEGLTAFAQLPALHAALAHHDWELAADTVQDRSHVWADSFRTVGD